MAGIYIDGSEVKEVWVDGVKCKEVWVDGVKVFPSKIVPSGKESIYVSFDHIGSGDGQVNISLSNLVVGCYYEVVETSTGSSTNFVANRTTWSTTWSTSTMSGSVYIMDENQIIITQQDWSYWS